MERPGAALIETQSQPARPRTSSGAVLLWGLPLVYYLVFFLFPLGTILYLAGQAALQPAAARSGLNVWAGVTRPLGFTFYQAGLSTLLTLVFGLPAAYVFGRFRFVGKSFLRVLITLPFIMPTVVVAAGFNALLGPRGWVNLVLMGAFHLEQPPVLFLNTFGAILVAHVFYNATVIIRVVGNAWENLDPRLEQAARVLGASGWRSFWEVTLPRLLPALRAATLLVFLFDFTSFGVILLLGGPRFSTLEVEIYIQALQLLNLPMAGLLSAVQLACTLVVMWVYNRLGTDAATPLAPRVKGEGLRAVRMWGERAAVGAVLVGLVALLLSPLGALLLRSVVRLEAERGQREQVQSGLTLEYYQELFVNRRGSLFYVPPVIAARNSLIYALTTVAISLGLGFPAAYALAKKSRVSRWMDPLLMLPLGTSAVTLGLGYVVTFNGPPLDVRSFPLLIPIAHSLVALPFVVRTLLPAITTIPPSLRQAAGVLGASPARTWLEVDLPILSKAALVGAVFAFTISLGEFGATSLLARPEFPTLPVAIYQFLSQPGALNYGQAMAMASLLMGVCALSILLIERVQE
jgi:thiamine transport system permease protein